MSVASRRHSTSLTFNMNLLSYLVLFLAASSLLFANGLPLAADDDDDDDGGGGFLLFVDEEGEDEDEAKGKKESESEEEEETFFFFGGTGGEKQDEEVHLSFKLRRRKLPTLSHPHRSPGTSAPTALSTTTPKSLRFPLISNVTLPPSCPAGTLPNPVGPVTVWPPAGLARRRTSGSSWTRDPIRRIPGAYARPGTARERTRSCT